MGIAVRTGIMPLLRLAREPAAYKQIKVRNINKSVQIQIAGAVRKSKTPLAGGNENGS